MSGARTRRKAALNGLRRRFDTSLLRQTNADSNRVALTPVTHGQRPYRTSDWDNAPLEMLGYTTGCLHSDGCSATPDEGGALCAFHIEVVERSEMVAAFRPTRQWVGGGFRLVEKTLSTEERRAYRQRAIARLQRKAQGARYRERNREKIAGYKRQYYQEHREAHVAGNRRRRAARRAA